MKSPDRLPKVDVEPLMNIFWPEQEVTRISSVVPYAFHRIFVGLGAHDKKPSIVFSPSLFVNEAVQPRRHCSSHTRQLWPEGPRPETPCNPRWAVYRSG